GPPPPRTGLRHHRTQRPPTRKAPCHALSFASLATRPRPPLPDGPVVSRTVRWAAHGAALSLVPSGLWRCAVAVGVPSGFAEGAPLHQSNFPGWTSLYLLALSAFAECLGLLTLGLI